MFCHQHSPVRLLVALAAALPLACDGSEEAPVQFTVIDGLRTLPPAARDYLDENGVAAADQEAINRVLREAPPGTEAQGERPFPGHTGDPLAEIPADERDLLLCASLKIAPLNADSVLRGGCWSVRRSRRVDVYGAGFSIGGASASVLAVVYRDDPRAPAQSYTGVGLGTTLFPPFWAGGQVGHFHGDTGSAYLGGLTVGIDILTAGSQYLGIVDPSASGAPRDGDAWFEAARRRGP